MEFGRENPCNIKLLERVRLSGYGSEKDVYRLIFDVGDLHYSCGDSLAVYPKNDPIEVVDVLKLLELDGKEKIQIKNLNFSLYDALINKFCITHLTKRFLDTFYERLNPIDCIKFNIEFRGEHEGQYSLCELLRAFKGIKFQPFELCKLLKKLSPRLYSIASSQALQRNKLRLIVGTVNYKNFWGNIRNGVVSTYLNHQINVGDFVDAYISISSFRMPIDATADIIMVGPGTGLAPFMSFLYEREFQKQSGLNIGRSWLFFGDQHEKVDFLECEELNRLKSINVLTKLSLAFSRDQEEKIYVQDRMWESRFELWNWLSRGASFYICGDGKRMAVDVEQTLRKIAVEVGNMSEQSSEGWLSNLKSSGRYQKDVY